MNRMISASAVALLCAVPALAAEPDNLVLPSGFHATVVAEGVGATARHMAVRGNDIYISTRHGANAPSIGIIAIRMGADHKMVETKNIAGIDQGTGIRVYKGYLYAASGTSVSRIRLDENLVPSAQPEVIVEGLTATNHPIAFDGRGNLYVGIDGGGGTNNCPDPNGPKDKPKGLMPCPLLETRGGVWKFSDSKPNQKLADGERVATGLRNMSAMDWRNNDSLYGAWHGRDGTSKGWPELVTQEQDNDIPDEMHKITRNTDMGWPYTYWDAKRNIRLAAPEYGGDGKTPVTDSKYTPPAATFSPLRPAVLDLAFYNGSKFPVRYRNGAFLAMHGGNDQTPVAGGRNGFNVVFVPFSGNRAGTPVAFAEGFAGTEPKNIKTAPYRPVGVAFGQDGAMYVLESNKGRIWRIAYGE